MQRWLKMSKYLPEYGWQPIIYTPENPDFDTKDQSLLKDISKETEVVKTKIKEPYRMYRFLTGKKEGSNFGMTKSANPSAMQRLSLWARGNLFIPDPRVMWRRPSVKYLRKYLKENPVDAVVTTGPPQSMHLIGLGLKKAMPELTWIADFRDPWSKFDFLENFNLTEPTLEKYRKMEREVLKFADKVVVVSPSLGHELEEFDHGKKRIVNNGFDQADFPENPRVNFEGKFTIYHAGLINNYRYFPVLWEALSELIVENAEFKNLLQIELVGNVTADIQANLKGFEELFSLINIRPWIAHDELMKEFKNANMLFLLPHQSVNAKGIIPGKVYEYLALKKPILNLGPTDTDVANILRETETGVTLPGKDKQGMKDIILKNFQDYLSKKAFSPDGEKIKQYSRKHLAGKFAKVLEEVV